MASNIIALDIGEKRIGVAIADMQTPFPAPLTTLETSQHLLTEFRALVHKNSVIAIVIGLPRNQQGEFTAQTERVKHIVKLLKIPKTIPVYWQDESLTSVKAEEELKSRKKSYVKAEVDALAATYILDDFIRTQASGNLENIPKQKTQKSKKSRKHRLLIKLLIGALLFLVTLILGVIGWYIYTTSPRTTEDVYSVISVKPGSGTQVIARQLEENGVIRSAAAFSLYSRLNGIKNLQAGEYRLSSKQSVKTITEIIADGKVTTVNVTVLPGQRLDEILATLQKDGYSEADLNTALSSVRSHPLLKDLPANTRLEGYLFPDTYKIGPSTSAEQLFNLMLDNFQSKLAEDSGIRAGLTAQGLSFVQGVTLASIVQEEVRAYDDQQKVAQVFLKRLEAGMPLGADPTFKYAATVFGGPNNPSNDSPYNTRKFTGLPPTPISNFNISALKAVANPSNSDYLYFVAGDDGTTHFSRTLEEHEALTERYCTTLCN